MARLRLSPFKPPPTWGTIPGLGPGSGPPWGGWGAGVAGWLAAPAWGLLGPGVSLGPLGWFFGLVVWLLGLCVGARARVMGATRYSPIDYHDTFWGESTQHGNLQFFHLYLRIVVFLFTFYSIFTCFIYGYSHVILL